MIDAADIEAVEPSLKQTKCLRGGVGEDERDLSLRGAMAVSVWASNLTSSNLNRNKQRASLFIIQKPEENAKIKQRRGGKLKTCLELS